MKQYQIKETILIRPDKVNIHFWVEEKKYTISLLLPCEISFNDYEVFDNNVLFEDIKRFSTLEQATKFIYKTIKYKLK